MNMINNVNYCNFTDHQEDSEVMDPLDSEVHHLMEWVLPECEVHLQVLS